MKKFLSALLAIVLALSFPITTLAVEDNNYNSIKEHVSTIYGIPMNIMDTLSEEKVRNLDVADEQVVSSQEVYVNFVTDGSGETTAIPSTEEDYLNYISSPAAIDNPSTQSNSWMKIYLIIIDNRDNTLNISSTYTWLIQPRVVYNQYDMLNLCWENGSYISGTAQGFYSYNTTFMGHVSEDFTSSDFEQPSENPKSINHFHPMNDSGARENEFFHMMVTLRKNTGAGMEHAWSYYGHQEKSINWTGLLGGAASIGGAIYIPNPYVKALSLAAGIAALSGGINTYYDLFNSEADYYY